MNTGLSYVKDKRLPADLLDSQTYMKNILIVSETLGDVEFRKIHKHT